MSIGIVSPREAQALIAQGAKLIDVRDADEYLREHIPHAQLAPLSRLEQGDLPANLRAEQIIFHCQSGKRTSSNAAKLQAIAAPAQVSLLEGGIDGWKAAGLPVTEDKSQPLPLMRQVQIAAGGLALLGLLWAIRSTAAFSSLAVLSGPG